MLISPSAGAIYCARDKLRRCSVADVQWLDIKLQKHKELLE
ncbi:hypothetical protein MIDIC_560005 [Alphaproteobacteria bacterium]